MSKPATYNLTTCHHSPWALVRRNGDTIGKRPSTRMAYLTGTIAPNGVAVALTGYVMRNDMTGWSKSKRRIEWNDIVRQWHKQPSVSDIRSIKKRMKIVREGQRHGVAVSVAQMEAR